MLQRARTKSQHDPVGPCLRRIYRCTRLALLYQIVCALFLVIQLFFTLCNRILSFEEFFRTCKSGGVVVVDGKPNLILQGQEKKHLSLSLRTYCEPDRDTPHARVAVFENVEAGLP